MPILTIEIVGEAADGVAQPLADAVGELFDAQPGRVWVRVRRTPVGDYAENGGTEYAPVFVSVLRADPPIGGARTDEALALTRAVAQVLNRPSEHVHVLYEPPARGRVAFGGKLVQRRPMRLQSGAPWEEHVGYCRVLDDRGHVYVTGTAPVADDGSTHAPGDPYEQARRCLELIERALGELGLDRTAIVRTRMFVTDISEWEAFGRAHSEFFDDHRPATTMVEVRRLIDDAMSIEIEADARG